MVVNRLGPTFIRFGQRIRCVVSFFVQKVRIQSASQWQASFFREVRGLLINRNFLGVACSHVTTGLF